MSELLTLVRIAPDNVAVLMQGAHVAYMLENYDQMKALCEQALAIDGEQAIPNYQMAQAVMGQGDMISGIAYLTKAITLSEELADARLLRAVVGLIPVRHPHGRSFFVISDKAM